MINEGIVGNEARIAVRSEMVRQMQTLGRATADDWERAVFESVTGGKREDVDWDVEDNQAGYRTWIKSFDGLVGELVDDGFVRREEIDGTSVLVAENTDPSIDWPTTSNR